MSTEILSKMTANITNIKLLMKSQSEEVIKKLLKRVDSYIALGRQDPVMREFSVCIFCALVRSSSVLPDLIADTTPTMFGHTLKFIEEVEEAAARIAQSPQGLAVGFGNGFES